MRWTFPSAHVLGHHTGIKVTAELALAHPDRTGKLIFYGPTLSSPEDMQAMWERLVPHEKEGRIHRPEPGGEHLASQFRRQEYYGGPEVAHRLLLTGLMAGPKWWYGHNAALTHDLRPAFMALKNPILLLTNPGEMGEDKTVTMAEARPDVSLVRLKTPGAIAMDTGPQEFVDAVMAFLREG